MKNHTKIIRIAFFSFLFLTLFSCQEKPDKTIINDKIAEQLKSGDNVDTFFIGLKFGMSKTEFDNYIYSQISKGNVKRTESDYTKYSYRYSNWNGIENVDWNFRPDFHNDTLIGVSLHHFENANLYENNFNSIDYTYRALVSMFTAKYSTADYIVGDYINYWFLKNLEIKVVKDEESLGMPIIQFSFTNARKRNKISLTNCVFDENTNTMDIWYYKQKKEKKVQDSIEESKIIRYSIQRLSKKVKYNKTNIYYKSYTLLYRALQEEAKKLMWEKSREEEEIERMKKYRSGGEITIFAERFSRDAADFENWTIIIKDLKDNELYRERLNKRNPHRGSDDMWRNYNMIGLNKRFETPFYVYLVDEPSYETHKFKVVPIKE